MDIIATLKRLGISTKQAAVYLAALELGEASITDLSRKAALKRPTTYLVIDDLRLMGLIAETKKGKRSFFSATHPRRLMEIVRARENQIAELLPELVAIYKTPKSRPKIQVFEGLEGIRSLYKELYSSLNNQEEAVWLTRIEALRTVPEAISEYKKILRKLHNPKIRELIYGDMHGRKWVKEIERLKGKNHHLRLVPEKYSLGFTDTLIFGSRVVLFSLQKDIFVISIENPDVAQSHKALFELAWNQAEKIV